MNNLPAAPTLDLRDIHAAPPPEFWPPAPGWWVLALLAASVTVFAALWLYRRYRLYRHRQLILRELDRLRKTGAEQDSAAFVTAVSTLLRRVALMRFARQRVAPLSGADWLRFLDDTGGDGEFSTGAGQILAYGPYVPALPEVPAERLLLLAESWMKKNLRGGA